MIRKSFSLLIIVGFLLGCVSLHPSPQKPSQDQANILPTQQNLLPTYTIDQNPIVEASDTPEPIFETPVAESACGEPEEITKETLSSLPGWVLLDNQESIGEGYESSDFYKLNFGSGELQLYQGTFADFSYYSTRVSPDRKRFAVQYLTANADGFDSGNSILIFSTDDSLIKSILLKKNRELLGWLDDNHLVTTYYEDKSSLSELEIALPIWEVINVETGEKRIFKPDYPEIYRFPDVPNWDGAGITMYDSTLSRVVYLGLDQEDFSINYHLYDVNHKKELSSVRMCCTLGLIPRWSPNGKNVALAGMLIDTSLITGELYLLSRDGVMTKVTNFSDNSERFFIDAMSWSPDSSKVAFWVREGESLEKMGREKLAVVDIETQQVTKYCVEGDLSSSIDDPSLVPEPLWSPDGKQILVQSITSNSESDVIIVDLSTQRLFKILENMSPVAWFSN